MRGALRRLAEPFTFEVSGGLSLRVYPDSRPHNLEIARLHKGLVTVLDGRELIGEGAGFGAPVVRYADKTYFPGSAEVFVDMGGPDGLVAAKSFVLDTVSRKRLAGGPYLSDVLYHRAHRAFTKSYLAAKGLRPLFGKVMELRRAAGVHTQFVGVEPRGRIDVEYRVLGSQIRVDVDLSGLDRRGCEEVVVLNEQGAAFFRRYSDSSGIMLSDVRIGAWDRVDAEEASLSDPGGRLTFRLRRVGGVTLYRGWEAVRGRLAWAGLNYSLKPTVPLLSYTVALGIRGSGKGGGL